MWVKLNLISYFWFYKVGFQSIKRLLGTDLGHLKENVRAIIQLVQKGVQTIFHKIKVFFIRFQFFLISPNVKLSFLWCPVGLWYSLESLLSWQRDEKGNPSYWLRFENYLQSWAALYLSAQVAVSSFTHLHCCDLKATQVNVAMSQAEFGLCNVVFGRSLVPYKKTHLMPIKQMTLLFCIYKTSLFRSFIFSSRLMCLPLLCPYLTSSPVLYLLSHFAPYLFLLAGKGNKMLLLWKLLTERREAAYETSSVETGAYIWPFPVCGPGGAVQPSMNIVSLFPVWKTTRQMEWQTERERQRDREREKGKQRDRKKDVWRLVGLILVIRFGRNCLVIVRPSSFRPVAQYDIHYS